MADMDIGGLLVVVKAMVQEATPEYEPVFTPKVVGWTIAGYFARHEPA